MKGNKKMIGIYDKKYWEWRDNIDDYYEYTKKWYENRTLDIKEKDKVKTINQCYLKYYMQHKDEVKEQENNNNIEEMIRKYRNNKDLKFNLNGKIRSAISLSLKGNKTNKSWEILVDYKLKDLINHLNKTMPYGYCWNDYLNAKLHIDHIIPISVFNFTKPEHTDFKRCWSLSNLRLLPARENLIKNAKLTRPFQPALAL